VITAAAVKDAVSHLNQKEDCVTKIVVDNSTPGGRQRQLEAQVQVAWANAASSVLNFLIGREADPVEAMKTFIAVHDAAEQESIDPNGIGIRGPDIGGATKGHPDEVIDTVLAGSLSMAAAMLQADARQPVPEPQGAYSDDAAYLTAQKQILHGFTMMQKEIKMRRRRYRELERRLFDPD
jgi:hypothetical protein